ncbi:MAG: type transport system ATP-binding protein [Solirubrobacterales bacterium]|jgi:ABC-2 type transport system ATP-binding protein|nr:type transport system ATP-binding protein [Solirubrobacterales bacterium]
MAAIEIDRISKAYARGPGVVPALSELSLEVDEGQALALLGPNGAGKSTVVRILSTLTRPDTGRASIAGFDVVGKAAQVRTCIGVALQEVGLYPAGRVRQVLLRHAQLFGLSRPAAARRCDEIIELAGLAKSSGQRVNRLSGGTRRRLDLGLALLHRPPVLLLDEPTSSLDPFSRREFWRELARLRDEGTCILFASQNIDEAEQLADRVAVLVDGAVWRSDIPVAAVRDVWGSDDVLVAP